MTSENKLKINQLLRVASPGTVLTTTWLKTQGISDKLAWWYVRSGWLERISDGAYCVAGHSVSWAGAIEALQQQLKLPIYPGGKTALQLLGKAHYLGLSLKEVQLFAPLKTKIPTWLESSYWKESFTVYRRSLFKEHSTTWETPIEIAGQSLLVSCPEKAALELCYLVPDAATFEETALILEGLSRMRPKLLQSLLEACKSYKAKRLLLYLAEHFQHPWVSEINFTQIDLGRGKRVISGGGHYNSKYKISVPLLEKPL